MPENNRQKKLETRYVLPDEFMPSPGYETRWSKIVEPTSFSDYFYPVQIKITMKTKNILRLFLIVIVSGLFLSSPVIASTPASECAATLWQKFQGKIRYPEFAHKQAIQGEVTVLFTVSDDGSIVVKDIRSTDTKLAQYIRDVMSTVQCPELENAGIYDFKVKFNFKLI